MVKVPQGKAVTATINKTLTDGFCFIDVVISKIYVDHLHRSLLILGDLYRRFH